MIFIFFSPGILLACFRCIGQIPLCPWTSSSKPPPKSSKMGLSLGLFVQQHFQLCFSSLLVFGSALLTLLLLQYSQSPFGLLQLPSLLCWTCSGEEPQPACPWCGCCCGQLICVFLQDFCRSALGHVPILACAERRCRNTEHLGLEGTFNIT